jgi:hypothetical protein
MPVEVEIKYSPPDLIERMGHYPRELDEEIGKGTVDAIDHVWGSVPAYPDYESWYVRTGKLGQTLGTEKDTGAKLSGVEFPGFLETKRLGAGAYEAKFGTNLHYAPRVIGDLTQEYPWRGKIGWWTIGQVLRLALPGIMKIFKDVERTMAAFLDGKG